MRKTADFGIKLNLAAKGLHLPAQQFHQVDQVQSCASSPFQKAQLLTTHSTDYEHMRTCTACK